ALASLRPISFGTAAMSAVASIPATASPGTGLTTLDAVLSGWSRSGASGTTRATAGGSVRDSNLSRTASPVPGATRTLVLQAAEVEPVLGARGAWPSLLSPDGKKTPGREA